MVVEYKYAGKPVQETIYGWYPGENEAAIRQSAKDVYVNLGTRPPKDQSYMEADLIYQYHQSIKPSERANCFSIQQTPEEAIKPPWSLHLATISNQTQQQEIDKQLEQRYESMLGYKTAKLLVEMFNL